MREDQTRINRGGTVVNDSTLARWAMERRAMDAQRETLSPAPSKPNFRDRKRRPNSRKKRNLRFEPTRVDLSTEAEMPERA